MLNSSTAPNTSGEDSNFPSRDDEGGGKPNPLASDDDTGGGGGGGGGLPLGKESAPPPSAWADQIKDVAGAVATAAPSGGADREEAVDLPGHGDKDGSKPNPKNTDSEPSANAPCVTHGGDCGPGGMSGVGSGLPGGGDKGDCGKQTTTEEDSGSPETGASTRHAPPPIAVAYLTKDVTRAGTAANSASLVAGSDEVTHPSHAAAAPSGGAYPAE